MLLHEVGHITQRSAAGEFSNGELSQLNIEPSIAKANEEEADDFAIALIREEISKVSPASLDANFVAMQLSKLGWNMQAYRTLDEFASAAVGKPSVFFDQTYSHPNLAWRVLRSNHRLHNSEATGRCWRRSKKRAAVAPAASRFIANLDRTTSCRLIAGQPDSHLSHADFLRFGWRRALAGLPGPWNFPS